MTATTIDRAEFLNSLIGKKWAPIADGPDAYDCYHLWRKVMMTLQGANIPDTELPDGYNTKWAIRRLMEEMVNWEEIKPHPIVGYAGLPDCTGVLMSGNQRLHHIGTWLSPESGILHVESHDGVVLYPYPQLKRMYGTVVFLRRKKVVDQ